MKLGMVIRLPFTFENWIPVVDGTTTTYVKHSEGQANLVGGANSLNLFTKEQLEIGSQVRNLRDAAGQEILLVNGLPYPMFITDATAQLNPFSELVGWKHKLARKMPRDLLAEIGGLIR